MSDRTPTHQTLNRTSTSNWIGPVVAVILLAAGAWYLLKPEPAPIVVVEKTPTLPAVTQPEPEPADVLSAQQEPVDEISAQAADAGADTTVLPAEQEVVATEPLPTLDESDVYVQQKLLALPWKAGLASLFVNEEMIRRFVVQVDNIAQGRIVPEQALFKGLAQDFKAQKNDQQYQLEIANYQRYQRYLDLLESAPKAEVVALFNRLYPLLQQAYLELGYPDAQFRDRVQQAIRLLLSAPEIADEPQLALESVQYTFADPEIEQLSMAHKQMVRLGLKNQQRLKLLLAAYQPLLAK
jgi:tetratricopeptide (TPR) repeat protein